MTASCALAEGGSIEALKGGSARGGSAGGPDDVDSFGSDDGFAASAGTSPAAARPVGAMPSSVCLRKGFVASDGCSAAGSGRAGSALVVVGGGSERDASDASDAGGCEAPVATGAMPSSVCLRRGLLVACNGSVRAGDGALVGTDGDEEGRGAGAGEDGRARGGSGGGGYDPVAATAGVSGSRDGEGAATVAALASGDGAALALSSAPQSASISSVGGAMEGRGGRALGCAL